MSRPMDFWKSTTETDQVAYEERSSILAVPVEVGDNGRFRDEELETSTTKLLSGNKKPGEKDMTHDPYRIYGTNGIFSN